MSFTFLPKYFNVLLHKALQLFFMFLDTSYNIETDTNCGGKLFEAGGKLQSPNYPSLYPNVANCQWVLSVPPSKVIEIEFVK